MIRSYRAQPIWNQLIANGFISANASNIRSADRYSERDQAPTIGYGIRIGSDWLINSMGSTDCCTRVASENTPRGAASPPWTAPNFGQFHYPNAVAQIEDGQISGSFLHLPVSNLG